jgi:hypothetical protein
VCANDGLTQSLLLGSAVLKGIEDAKSRGKKPEELHVRESTVLTQMLKTVQGVAAIGVGWLTRFDVMQAIITELDRKHLRTGSRHDSWWRDQVWCHWMGSVQHMMLLGFWQLAS